MYPNPLKAKLQAGEIVYGTAMPIASERLALMACQADIDFLWIDTEHSSFGAESLDLLPAMVRQRGVAPMIRVAWNDPALIKKAYDVGAVAVMVPQVNTAEEAAKAVEYSFYPPKGNRGISPGWPQIAGEDWMNVIRTANDETVLIVQIESQQAFDNLEEIAAVPGIDVLLAGPMDLSASLGVATQLRHPKVLEILEEIPKRVGPNGPVIGTTLGDVGEIQEKFRWGYRFMNVGSPVSYGVQLLDQHLATLKANPRG